MEYFEIRDHQVLCSVSDKLEYWLIDFYEKNELPNGYSVEEYESKGFTEPCVVQDFPIRGKEFIYVSAAEDSVTSRTKK